MTMVRMHCCVVCMVLCVLSGCHLPPRAADPNAWSRGVKRELVLAPAVHIEVLRVNDADVPEAIWRRVLDRFSRYVAGEVVVTDHGRIDLPADSRGDLLEAFDWPIADEHGPITVERMVAEGRERMLLDSHVIVSAQRVEMRDPEGGLVGEWIEPSVPGNVVLLAIVPADPGYNHTGYMRGLHMLCDDGGAMAWRVGGALVTVQVNVINRRAMFGPAQRALLEWTLFHELGHALGVPADPSRITMKLGAHCTYPHCVMYSPVDLRWIVSLFLNGWPMELCAKCDEELREALEAAREEGGAVQQGERVLDRSPCSCVVQRLLP
jgi:predicted Zn-dependent protease